MKLFALVLTLCVASALAGEQRRLGASIAADPPAATATAAAADPKTKASTDEKSGKVAAAVEKGEKALNGVADKGLALLDSTPGSHLSVAMRAVLMLVFLFFIVQTIIKLIETKIELRAATGMAPAPQTKQGGAAGGDLAYGEMADDDAAMHKKAYSMFVGFFSLQSMNAMVNTMNVVPMLCILMIFARLRATSDLHTSPQPYARGFFIVTALCVYIQALLAVFFPKSGKGCCYWVGKILDWTATLILYVGIVCIVASICTLERCAEPENRDHKLHCALDTKDMKTVIAAYPNLPATAAKEFFL